MLGDIYVTQVYSLRRDSKNPEVIRFNCGDLQVSVDLTPHTHDDFKDINVITYYVK